MNFFTGLKASGKWGSATGIHMGEPTALPIGRDALPPDPDSYRDYRDYRDELLPLLLNLSENISF